MIVAHFDPAGRFRPWAETVFRQSLRIDFFSRNFDGHFSWARFDVGRKREHSTIYQRYNNRAKHQKPDQTRH